MPTFIEEFASFETEQTDRKIYGVTIGQVINNIDSSREGRVQVKLPWLPTIEPWARVSTSMAGKGGSYFMPQPGDEVLVAFNHGDVRDPFVIGSLWNGTDRSPNKIPSDAVNKRIIHTPMGLDITFDDSKKSITITAGKQKVTMAPGKIELDANNGAAHVTLSTEGDVKLEAQKSITLKAPKISIEGQTLALKGSAKATLDGGSMCEVKAAMVKIN